MGAGRRWSEVVENCRTKSSSFPKQALSIFMGVWTLFKQMQCSTLSTHRVLQKQRRIINGDGNDAVVLPGRMVHRPA